MENGRVQPCFIAAPCQGAHNLRAEEKNNMGFGGILQQEPLECNECNEEL
jgi:hypothetical protein